MPPIRPNELEDDEIEKDSNTPQPDVEHEHQQATYTFLSEMAASSSEELPPTDFLPAPSTTHRTSHGKRRDASYIPRPPNAFILFRSSFVRDQKVTNKVEGNHSNLSKIIGKYWKALPKEQRDEWEAKAAQALIDHRKRYPDWRFRPASNTTANNAQTKAKGKAAGVRRGRTRKASVVVAGEDGAHEQPPQSPRPRPGGRSPGRTFDDESRISKIATLLAEGQEGVALERAVQEWEAKQREPSHLSASSSSSLGPSTSPLISGPSTSGLSVSIPGTPSWLSSSPTSQSMTSTSTSTSSRSNPPSCISSPSFSPAMARPLVPHTFSRATFPVATWSATSNSVLPTPTTSPTSATSTPSMSKATLLSPVQLLSTPTPSSNTTGSMSIHSWPAAQNMASSPMDEASLDNNTSETTTVEHPSWMSNPSSPILTHEIQQTTASASAAAASSSSSSSSSASSSSLLDSTPKPTSRLRLSTSTASSSSSFTTPNPPPPPPPPPHLSVSVPDWPVSPTTPTQTHVSIASFSSSPDTHHSGSIPKERALTWPMPLSAPLLPSSSSSWRPSSPLVVSDSSCDYTSSHRRRRSRSRSPSPRLTPAVVHHDHTPSSSSSGIGGMGGMKRSSSLPPINRHPYHRHRSDLDVPQPQPQGSTMMPHMASSWWWPVPSENPHGSGSLHLHLHGHGHGHSQHRRHQHQHQHPRMMEEPTRDGSFDALPEVETEEDEEEGEGEGEGRYDNGPGIGKDGHGWASDGWNWSQQYQDGSKPGYGLDSPSPSSPSFPNPNPNPLASPSCNTTNPNTTRWYQQQHQPWDTDSTIQAGDSIHPTPATPISPSQLMFVRSTESSLAGWDGSNMGSGSGLGSASVGVGVGIGATTSSPQVQVPPSSSACGSANAGVAWGSSVQRVGVQDWSRGWG